MIIFKDRKEAGMKLAEHLAKYREQNPIILGMPRGGVILAYEIAKALSAELDVIVARKIGAPGQPEFAIGAIAPQNVVVFNEAARHYYDFNSASVKEIIAYEETEMQRRIYLYRSGKKELNLKDQVVIIVDDGVATGQSAIAAIRSVRKMKPGKIIFAAGVGAHDSIRVLRHEADEVICLATPEPFSAVGLWYENFTQTTDEDVIELLKLSQAEKRSEQ